MLYIRVTKRVTEQLKTYERPGKSENIIEL